MHVFHIAVNVMDANYLTQGRRK